MLSIGARPSRAARTVARITTLARITTHCTILFAVVALAACASDPPPATFDLDPSIHQFGHVAKSARQLAIYEPTAAPPLASRRIVVRTSADGIAYLHGAQWATDLPRLVQDRLIDGFESAHALRAVGGAGFVADHSLQTEIERFEANVGTGQAVVEIDAKILAGDGRVIAQKTFSETSPAANDHVETIVAALRDAFAKAVHDIVIWAAPRA